MKKAYIILILLFTLSKCLFANDKESNDSIAENVKTGWSLMPLPMFSYASNAGLSLGLNLQLYNYGDGKIYPNLYNLILIQGEYNTTNSGNGRVYFYSSKFLKHFEFVADVGYFVEKNAQFRGFNGFMSKTNEPLKDYMFTRNLFAGYLELYKPIYKNLKVAVGVEMFSFVNESKSENSLLGDYISEKIINENEAGGGNNIYFKAGLIYDSRDIKAIPSKGFYSYVALMYSPDIFDGRNLSHLLLSVQHCQYIDIWKGKFQFAYRLGYQSIIAGDCPYYLLPRIHSFNLQRPNLEGVGGAFTVRGMGLARIVGNDMFFSNFEFRFSLINFKLWVWDVELGLNPFFDAGMVTRPYHKEQMLNALENGRGDIISPDKEFIHCSYGIGGKIILNKTTVLSGEIGFPIDKRDGKFGMFFGVDFIF